MQESQGFMLSCVRDRNDRRRWVSKRPKRSVVVKSPARSRLKTREGHAQKLLFQMDQVLNMILVPVVAIA